MHFKKYGFMYLLFLLWAGSWALHFDYSQKVATHEAEQHGQQLDLKEHKDEWLSQTFENHQSEMAQLFIQMLGIGVLAHVWFKKEKEDMVRIEEKIDKLLKQNA